MSFPGVPPLLNKIAGFGNKVNLLVADAKLVLGLFGSQQPQWGIYKDGKLAIKPDSVISIEQKREWRVADYPMEDGAFQSYNKVKVPRTMQLRMTKGKSVSERSAFLSQIFQMASSTNLYDVYMPEGKLTSSTINHYDFRRTSSNGVGLLTVDVWLVEVMITVQPQFTNTKTFSGNSATQAGTVQGVPPTDDQRVAAALAAGA